MTVGEFCNREVVVIDQDESLLTAVKLMREHHVGDVVVTRQTDARREPLGILTDRDIVLEILAPELDLDAVSVGDVMSSGLFTAGENDSLMATIKRLRARGVRRVPVLDEAGALVGILSVDDIIELLAEQMADLARLFTREQEQERESRR